MFTTNDCYEFNEFEVGTAVACKHLGKKYLGIVTASSENLITIFWEGDDDESLVSKKDFDKGSMNFCLAKDYKRFKHLMEV